MLSRARHSTAQTINSILTASYWEVGRRIIELEQRGHVRAAYGEGLWKRLAADLTARHGRGFSKSNIALMRAFSSNGKFSLRARQLVRRFRDQAALRTGSGNARSGRTPSRRQASSSPFRRAASSAARASTPCGDQLIPWCLQRADTAQL